MTETAQFLKSQKKHSGRLLSMAVAMGSAGGLLVIAQAWCLANLVNEVVFRDQTLAQIMPWLWGMLGILLLRVVVGYLAEQVAFIAASHIKHDLRQRLYEKLQQLGPAYLSGQRSGEISTLLVEGVEGLDAYYSRYLPAMSLAVWIPLSILVFVFPLDWKSGLVMVLTAPLIPFFMILIGKGAERLNQKQWQQLARLGGHFLDVIQGLSTLKLFNASRREARMIEAISEDYRHATMKVLRVAFLSSLALEFFATVSIAVVAVLIGFRLLFGEMIFLNGFFVLLLAPEFYLPLRSLGVHYHGRMQAIATSERIVEVLQASPSVTTEQRLLRPAPGPLDIRFEGVRYAYDDRPALEGVDLSIAPGEHVALVGPSGAGKTTLINLLLGFLQADSGRILLNGNDLDRIDLALWRQQIAWIPQRPRLFHGTVRNNIALGLADVSDSAVITALQQAQALEFVQRLPRGVDTLVGEGGHGLSGGQVQRLSLARAMLRDARLLILDEPTAHLDRHNEKLVQQAIQQASARRSVLTVAHRLQTIERADRIVVLDHGRVMQQGRHSQLVSEPGLYRQLILASGLAS
jgi:ATP-binding cassette subfamily C protein CydD